MGAAGTGRSSQLDPNADVIVLGVDPGLRVTGYGVLRCSPSATLLLDFNHIKTDARAPIEEALILQPAAGGMALLELIKTCARRGQLRNAFCL